LMDRIHHRNNFTLARVERAYSLMSLEIAPHRIPTQSATAPWLNSAT
jgi:hypothetical protein